MVYHRQGSLFNAAELARSLRISVPSVVRYADTLVDTHAGAPPAAYFANVGKRLIKTPGLFVRDSGIVHSRLNFGSLHDLLGHPVAGATWEGLAMENLIGAAPPGTDAFFYRTRSGAEIDLLLLLPGDEPWAIGIKRTAAPKVPKGFRIAMADVGASRSFIVYPGSEAYPLGHGVLAIPLPELMKRLIARR